jgi:hypothetical protein
MHLPGKTLLLICASIVFSTTAFAQESGFFAGVDVSGGTAQGSSSTRDGGAPFAGGGIVKNLRLGNTVGFGGHAGYRFSDLSVFVSYQHVRGSVSWDADFPAIGATSNYAGFAVTDAVLANVAYDWPLTHALTFRTSAGLGVAFNTLSGVAENDQGSGAFLSNVGNHTQVSPAAQVGVGFRYKLMPRMELGLDAAVAYTGGFRTGDTRTGNLGVTQIVPYKIDNVWRPSLWASLQYKF